MRTYKLQRSIINTDRLFLKINYGNQKENNSFKWGKQIISNIELYVEQKLSFINQGKIWTGLGKQKTLSTVNVKGKTKGQLQKQYLQMKTCIQKGIKRMEPKSNNVGKYK